MKLSVPQIADFEININKIRNTDPDNRQKLIDELIELYKKKTSIEQQAELLRNLFESYIEDKK